MSKQSAKKLSKSTQCLLVTPQKPALSEPVLSEYTNLYHEKMKDMRSTSSLQQLFQGTQVDYISEFQQNFSLQVKETSINKQVVILRAFWGNLSLAINVLNINGQNISHGEFVSAGVSGDVFKYTFRGKNFVMKCMETKHKQVNRRAKAIKEWFIMKICSILKVGPQIEPYFGFDILMYSECVEFAMEVCQPITNQNMSFADLYKNLHIMHQMRLVHLDIKNENIIYSPSLKKVVFIDFGLSKFITQDIGFKTKTNYVGTINYWSPEMDACYRKKSETNVDLYYNDLHCLEVTRKDFKDLSLIEDSWGEFSECIKPKLNEAMHLNFVQLKFYLYFNQMEAFHSLWKKLSSNSNLIYNESQILYFMEEMPPTKVMRKLFKTIISDVHSQTLIYSKLKVLYQISKISLFSIDSLQNQQKLEYNESVLESYYDKEQALQRSQKPSKITFLTSHKLIRKTPFLSYLGSYLQYQSYLNNKHSVNKDQRKAVAEVYFRVFISASKSLPQTCRDLVKETIDHALRWLLNNYYGHSQSTYALLLFRILDFLIILDSPSKTYLDKCQQMFNHPCMNNGCRKLLVKKKIGLNLLCFVKITSQKQISVFEFSCLSQKWIEQKKAKLQNLPENEQIPRQVYQEYGYDDPHRFKATLGSSQQQLFIEFYNELILKKNVRVYYFLLELYICKAYDLSSSLRKQIEAIAINNIADQDICKQFIFEYNQIICDKINLKNPEDMKSKLLMVDEKLKKIDERDLFTFLPSIEYLSRSVHTFESIHQLSLRFIFEEQYFFYRFYRSYFEVLKRFIRFLVSNQFRQLIIININRLFAISKWFSPAKNSQVESMIYEQLQLVKYNSKYDLCKNILDFSVWTSQLQIQLTSYLSLDQESRKDKKNYEGFFILYDKILKHIQKDISSVKINHIFLYNTLYYSQLMCYMNLELEQKYNGMKNFYLFTLRNNRVMDYFVNDRLIFVLNKVITILWASQKEELCRFLFHICHYLEENCVMRHYSHFQKILTVTFSKDSSQNLWNFYLILRKFEKTTQIQTICITLVYSILLSFMLTDKQKKIIFCAMKNKVDKLHYSYQRHIRIRLFMLFYMNPSIKSRRRRWINYNNKLVKLATNENWEGVKSKSNSSLRMRRDESIQNWMLRSKMNQFKEFTNSWGDLKFRKIKDEVKLKYRKQNVKNKNESIQNISQFYVQSKAQETEVSYGKR